MKIIQDHSQHLRLSQRAISHMFAESYIHLSVKYVSRNLMQGSIRDFFISNVKNIPQNKIISVMYCKKKQ